VRPGPLVPGCIVFPVRPGPLVPGCIAFPIHISVSMVPEQVTFCMGSTSIGFAAPLYYSITGSTSLRPQYLAITYPEGTTLPRKI
jgi:hypothetical protein